MGHYLNDLLLKKKKESRFFNFDFSQDQKVNTTCRLSTLLVWRYQVYDAGNF